MKKDAKTTYAQSSHIKSRTFLEYRKDMKKKAIAELEALPWLERKLRETDPQVEIAKHGGDRSVWFLRSGGITRDPDFIVRSADGKERFIEFQYTTELLRAYDFKISKIAPKDRQLKKRVPKRDTTILYILKPSSEFAFLDPAWIMEHGKETVAAAWGNAPVYQVSAQAFRAQFKKDAQLVHLCVSINQKLAILEFQHRAIDIETEKISVILQRVIDEEQVLKIMPKTLDGFFQACFFLNHIEKRPENAGLWIIYLLSFFQSGLNAYDLFKLIYSFDFLYSRVILEKHEYFQVLNFIKRVVDLLTTFAKTDGSFQSDKTISPIEDTRYALFGINVLEDIIQDLLYEYHYHYDGKMPLNPIVKIYQTVPDPAKTAEFIKGDPNDTD